ncbi:MAG: hypothetical protein WC861_03490 [Candidatus Micrarchaeia archaeon]|jgi:hypothetical protein
MFLFQGTGSVWGKATIEKVSKQQIQAETIVSDAVAKGKSNNEIVQGLKKNGFEVEVKDKAGVVLYPPGFVPKQEEFNKNKELSLNVIQNEKKIAMLEIDKEKGTINGKQAEKIEAVEERLNGALAVVNDLFTGKYGKIEELAEFISANANDPTLAKVVIEIKQTDKMAMGFMQQPNSQEILNQPENAETKKLYETNQISATEVVRRLGLEKDFKNWLQEQLDAIGGIKDAGTTSAPMGRIISYQWQGIINRKDEDNMAEVQKRDEDAIKKG